jgi:hypothetical protein
MRAAAAEAVTVEVDLAAGDTSEAAEASMVAVLVAEAWRT